MDIEALAIACRSQADRAGVHVNEVACDKIIAAVDNIKRTSQFRAADPVLLTVLIDNLAEHVVMLKRLNGVAE